MVASSLNNQFVDGNFVRSVPGSQSIYVAGENHFGQLITKVTHMYDLTLVEDLPRDFNIKLVACAQNTTVIVSDKEEIYLCGSTAEALRSDPHAGFITDKIGLFLLDTTSLPQQRRVVTKLTCGFSHFIVVFNDNEICTVGTNGSSALSRSSQTKIEKVEGVLANNQARVSHIACGAYFSALVLENQFIYASGSNEYGQCCNRGECQVFTPVNDPDNVQAQLINQLVCGPSHMAILTGQKRLYMCGSNSSGQFGSSLSESSSNTFREIIFQHPINYIVGNRCINGLGIVTPNNELYMSGENDKGNQFLRAQRNVAEFQHVDSGGRWCAGDRLQFSFGFYHAHVVKNGVQVFGVGSNAHSQLGKACYTMDDEPEEEMIEIPIDHLKLHPNQREILTVESGASYGIFIVGQPVRTSISLLARALQKKQLTDIDIICQQ